MGAFYVPSLTRLKKGVFLMYIQTYDTTVCEENAILIDYSTLMYPKGNEGGYVAVGTKVDGIYKQRMVTVLDWINAIDYDVNCYLSVNTYYKPQRNVRSVRHLNAFYVDIDYYKHGVSFDDVMHTLQHHIEHERIVKPTYIIDSGRGIYLIFKIEDVPGKYKQTKNLYSAVQQYICDLFADVGADYGAKDIARVLRVPTTMNTKANKRVTILEHNADAIYTMAMFRELVYPFGLERASKAPVRTSEKKGKLKYLYNAYTLYKARSEDLKTVCKLRNYDVRGMRDKFLFIYHYFMMQIHQVEQVALYYTLNLNEDFVEPLEEKEVKSLVKSSVRAYYDHLEDKTKGYNYKNETLIDLLEITEDEQVHLKTIISKDIKYARNNERRKASRRSENGLTKRQKDKLSLIERVQELHEQGVSNKQIAEQLEISLSTVKRCRRAVL